YSVSVSILLGVTLLSFLGAFRGASLKQSAADSAIKMVILGVVIIVASRILGNYVGTVFLNHPESNSRPDLRAGADSDSRSRWLNSALCSWNLVLKSRSDLLPAR